MALASIAALAIYPLLPNQRFSIDLHNTQRIAIEGDGVSGGSSVASVIESSNSKPLSWRCELKSGYQFPYCSTKIHLFDEASMQGVDLSSYKELLLRYSYRPPTTSSQTETIRLYVRNHNPAYSNLDDFSSMKYNELEFQPSTLGDEINLPLDVFKVSHWWLLERNLPIELSRIEFNQVMVVELVTGTYASFGEHFFQLKELTFTKPLVSASNYYLAIVIVWVALSLSFVFWKALTLKRDNRKYHHLAIQDPLTELLNRHGIQEKLKQHQRAAASVLLFDLDHFKKVNDVYGHGVGDEVLKAFANLLRLTCRQNDIAARWGGEEFVVICFDTDAQQAKIVAAKVRQAMTGLVWPQQLNVTTSIGVAEAGADDSFEVALNWADIALYQAKEQGRDQVIVYQHATNQ
ncbi:GGDEF domain-containing protein [Neiella marina]|uniref:GGDEF domain-containing protein n=1 Tax=Neiella marina TaxID=508461 RepID=UPI001669591B|nr:GGDEF domain-containing protein [Neiella marina]